MHPFFKYISQFHQLNESASEELHGLLHRVELSKHHILLKENKVCDQVFFLEKGALRGYYNMDGKEVTYWFAFENAIVTSFYSFITQKASVESIELIEDSILWTLHKNDLESLYKRHHDLERLGRIITEQYYVMLEDRFVNNHFSDSKERYLHLLDSAPHILQRVPLGYIASYLGMSQETLSRIRAKV